MSIWLASETQLWAGSRWGSDWVAVVVAVGRSRALRASSNSRAEAKRRSRSRWVARENQRSKPGGTSARREGGVGVP